MSDPVPRPREVFLSYSIKDKGWADDACASLEGRGLRCWIAPRDILPGTEYGAAIIEGIAACRVMVLIFSADANASPQVRREVERAVSRGMPLVTFRVEDVLPVGALEYGLGNTHWLDGFKPPRGRQLEALVAAVEALIAVGSPIRPAVAPVRASSRPAVRPIVAAAIAAFVAAIGAGVYFLKPPGKKIEVAPGPDKVPSRPSPAGDEPLITNTLGMRLKLIPAGEFAMGSDATDPMAHDDEKVVGRRHPVRITKPFYLGTTEVTVGQFRRFVEASGYQTEAERDGLGGFGWGDVKGTFEQDPKYSWRSTGFPQADDHPVVLVSWDDAVAFCEWLSRREGKTYRLPTEAEWEYSCRAGQATRFSSGDDPESLATVGNVADGTWKERYPRSINSIQAKDGFVFTAPVGYFRPNAFGLHDMHGNVSEWCADWYGSQYYSGALAVDPLNLSKGSARVIRGGSWGFGAEGCRAALRYGSTPTYTHCDLGLRLARVP